MYKVLRHKADLSDFDNEEIIYENFNRNENGGISFTVERDRYSFADTQELIVKNDFDRSNEGRIFFVEKTVRQGYVVKDGKRHWCYDGKVNIDGETYDVDFVNDEAGHIVSGRIFTEDKTYFLKNSDQNEWKYLERLTCPGKLDMPVEFEDLYTMKEVYSFTYTDGKEYELHFTNEDGYFCYLESTNNFGETVFTKTIVYFNSNVDPSIGFKVTIDGTHYFACQKQEIYGDGGNVLVVATESPYMFYEGERIIIKSFSNIEIKRPIYEGLSSNNQYHSPYYTLHNGRAYPINPEIALYGNIDGVEKEIIRDEEYSESGETYVAIGHFVDNNSSNILLIRSESGLTYTTCYAENSPFQNSSGVVRTISGVIFDGKEHYVEEIEEGKYIVNFKSKIIGDFIVSTKKGNMIYLTPAKHTSSFSFFYEGNHTSSGVNIETSGEVASGETELRSGEELSDDDGGSPFGLDDIFDKQGRQMCSLCENLKLTVEIFKSDLTPQLEFTDDSSEYLQVKNKIRLFSPGKSIRFNFGLSCDASNSLYDEIRNSKIAENLIGFGNAVDMERVPYIPAFETKEPGKYATMSEIRFNLHFRTRTNIDGQWELPDPSNPAMDNFSTWFINDFYWRTLSGDENSSIYNYSLVNSSDLLGYLGFIDNDVYYHKKKLSKSFLRLTFYDSCGKGRKILGQSTIFVDENALFSKYIANMNSRRKYQAVVSNSPVPLPEEAKSLNKISVMSELYDTIFDIGNDMRLDSRIVVKDLLSSESSSEGFRLYLYKDMCNGLYERTIYMKVEYNHAGFGKTIPFMLLKSKEYGTPIKSISELYDNNFENGIDRLEKNSYEYIPVRIKFSEDLNSYIYDFPFIREENAVINLFETKIMEEGKDDYKFA